MRIVADTEEEIKRFIAMHQSEGWQLVGGPNLMWWADLRPDMTPPPPLQWWDSLKLTDPKMKIYAAHDGTQVYYSAPNGTPAFGQKAYVSAGGPLWTLPSGKDVEVWRAPIAGSGWICVHISPIRELWMRGEDMQAAP